VAVKASNPFGGKVMPIGKDRARIRTSDRVYDELVSAIRSLRIPPGASLSETELSEQLQVSRTPLREAIVRLVDNGLVSVIPQVGTTVELIGLRDVEAARFVRESLELSAFAIACADPARDVSVMRDLLAEQERCHARDDVDAFFEADEALHEQILVLSGYPGIWAAMQPLKLQLDRLRRLSLPDRDTVRALIDEHTVIVDALEQGDVATGSRQITDHIGRVRRYAPMLREQHPDFFTD
jgi:DNA-binding GntR family transcriptional regulator